MTGGAGHIMDMNNRMKQNRSMKTSKRQKFKSNNRETIFNNNPKETKVFINIPKNDLEKLKNEIKQKIKQQQRKELFLILTILAFGLLTTILLYLKLY